MGGTESLCFCFQMSNRLCEILGFRVCSLESLRDFRVLRLQICLQFTSIVKSDRVISVCFDVATIELTRTSAIVFRFEFRQARWQAGHSRRQFPTQFSADA